MKAATARWLLDNTNLRAVVAARGRDADRDVFVDILKLIKDASASDYGSSAAETVPAPGPLKVPSGAWLGVCQAAALIGISPEAVRLAVRQERLPAQKVGGIYLITETDAHEYARARRRRAA